MAKHLTRPLNADTDDLSQSLLELQARQRELLTIVRDGGLKSSGTKTYAKDGRFPHAVLDSVVLAVRF